ncbi:MAG TPA: hypothetical protein VIX73_13480 [Kofleriaceae bacterium]
MKVILDAGAFVAIERRDRRIEAMLRVLHEQRVPLWTSAAVVAQVWRNGRKQVLLARILPAVGVRPLASGDDTRIGELLAVTRTNDVIDGHVALLADDADRVVTSDPADLARLIEARGVDAKVVTV